MKLPFLCPPGMKKILIHSEPPPYPYTLFLVRLPADLLRHFIKLNNIHL